MSPTVLPTEHENKIADAAATAATCLFLCTPSGFPKENVLAVFHHGENDVFTRCRATLTTILPFDTQKLLCESLKQRDAHYVLLLTNDKRPLLVVSSLAQISGLCLAIELRESPQTVLAFARTTPTISLIKDPAFDAYSPSSEFDPGAFTSLGRTLRAVFSFFESTYTTPAVYTDPIALFRLLHMKITRISELFGMNVGYVLQNVFDDPPRTDAPLDTDLFASVSLLLLCAAPRYALDGQVHAVYMTVDRCPAVCIHFRVDSDLYERSTLLKYAKNLSLRHGTFFRTCHGELARRESEKIPGVGHMIRNDRYSALGDHALTVFSPIKRDWTEYVNHSPIFRLPDRFFEGFDFGNPPYGNRIL